jgi:hypothetical protein
MHHFLSLKTGNDASSFVTVQFPFWHELCRKGPDDR